MANEDITVEVGDEVTLKGFQPMSNMQMYEGEKGVVVATKPGGLGQIVQVKLLNGNLVNTRAKYCKKNPA